MTKERNNSIFLIGIFLLFVLLIIGRLNQSVAQRTAADMGNTSDSVAVFLPMDVPVDFVKNTPR